MNLQDTVPRRQNMLVINRSIETKWLQECGEN